MIDKDDDVIVSICCLTYNHEPYIRQCLEGFVIQKTNFRFEAIVHDDASTDRTAAIIKEYAEKYPDIIKPIFETENQYSKHDGSLRRRMNEHTHGKYVALCEGDDYWIDPLKLQKQVDFLEAHPNYGLVCGDTLKYVGTTFSRALSYHRYKKKSDNSYLIDKIIIANPIETSTTCFKRELMIQYHENVIPEKQNWKMGDYPLWLWIAIHSKIHHLNEVLSVYRILPESASHSSDPQRMIDFCLSALSIKLFYIDKYNLGERKSLHAKVYIYFMCKKHLIELEKWDTLKENSHVFFQAGRYVTYFLDNLIYALRNHKRISLFLYWIEYFVYKLHL